jgi:hypothetical protein
MYLWEDEAWNERYVVDIHGVMPLTRYLFRRLEVPKSGLRTNYQISPLKMKF